MTTSLDLRSQAEIAASTLPALLAGAEHLATTVLLGDHGRRRAGMGDTFWQYRTAQAGDDLRSIDWRRVGFGQLPGQMFGQLAFSDRRR